MSNVVMHCCAHGVYFEAGAHVDCNVRMTQIVSLTPFERARLAAILLRYPAITRPLELSEDKFNNMVVAKPAPAAVPPAGTDESSGPADEPDPRPAPAGDLEPEDDPPPRPGQKMTEEQIATIYSRAGRYGPPRAKT